MDRKRGFLCGFCPKITFTTPVIFCISKRKVSKHFSQHFSHTIPKVVGQSHDNNTEQE